jgi:hypothetical protein
MKSAEISCRCKSLVPREVLNWQTVGQKSRVYQLLFQYFECKVFKIQPQKNCKFLDSTSIPTLLKLSRNRATVYPKYLPEFIVSEYNISPNIVVALTAHHTSNFISCNGI